MTNLEAIIIEIFDKLLFKQILDILKINNLSQLKIGNNFFNNEYFQIKSDKGCLLLFESGVRYLIEYKNLCIIAKSWDTDSNNFDLTDKDSVSTAFLR